MDDDDQEAMINHRLRSPKNLHEIWPRRCCATCGHLLVGDDGEGVLVSFCERPDGPSYWSEGENHDEQFYHVCDYWKFAPYPVPSVTQQQESIVTSVFIGSIGI